VLVIDDDVAAVELLASQLHQRGCTVLRALSKTGAMPCPPPRHIVT
jgi:CheY-like chemotaxis protein